MIATAHPLADLLRHQRARLDLSLRALVANGPGVTASSASTWERGAIPRRLQLAAIATIYALPLEVVADAWQAARAARRSAT